ncbi:MAG: cold shock domain-containing protein [Chitinophagaceae bacterium]|nr:cold shock domain-containing protein [Chitinophagaceae bacterium]
MGQETMGKKEREKKKKQKKQQKQEKKLERKENNNKGKGLDDMIAYIDEYGNISDTPPDPKNMTEIAAEDIQLGAAPAEPRDTARKGIVKFYSEEKGYGFIIDKFTKESYFVHASELNEPITEQNTVSFEPGKGPKGKIALNVTKLF